jgi:hypothetical protein
VDDATINRALLTHQTAVAEAGDWELGGYAKVIPRWYAWLVEDGLVPSKWGDVDLKHPPIKVTFERRKKNELAHYKPSRDASGQRWNICFNLRHLGARSEADLAADLLHEVLHLCECQAGSGGHGNYHTAEFRRVSESLGIPTDKHGRDHGITEGGRFDLWATARGLSRGLPEVSTLGPMPAPKPKRVSWRCACPEAAKVLVPAKTELDAVCRRCEARFERV